MLMQDFSNENCYFCNNISLIQQSVRADKSVAGVFSSCPLIFCSVLRIMEFTHSMWASAFRML